ncbi:MAG: hypothetical protein ACTHOL_19655 [Luteibacter jiangsuensis]
MTTNDDYLGQLAASMRELAAEDEALADFAAEMGWSSSELLRALAIEAVDRAGFAESTALSTRMDVSLKSARPVCGPKCKQDPGHDGPCDSRL